MTRTILGLLAAVVLVLQAACLPLKTVQPIGTLDEAQLERQAVGAWQFQPQDGSAPLYLHVGLASGQAHENLMSCSTARVGEDGRLSVSTRDFYVVEIAGKKYAHLLDPNGQETNSTPGFELYRFEQEADTLRLYSIDRQAIAALANAGEIEAEVTRSQGESDSPVTDVQLTGSTESLREFLEGGGELFSSENVMEFTRVPH